MNRLREKFFLRISQDFEVMSKMVIQQIHQTQRLLETNTLPEIYTEIHNNERIIDSLDVKMRDEVINTIVLCSPRAGDLRKIMAYYDMTAYLERIGDLLINISIFMNQVNIGGAIFPLYKNHISKLWTVAENMVQNAIFAFTCEDNNLAKETINLDDIVDTLHHELTQKLRTQNADKTLKEQQLTDILSLSSISYNIERIGDNATNIAEAAIYLMEGKNIKHQGKENTDILQAGSEG